MPVISEYCPLRRAIWSGSGWVPLGQMASSNSYANQYAQGLLGSGLAQSGTQSPQFGASPLPVYPWPALDSSAGTCETDEPDPNLVLLLLDGGA